MDDVGYEPLMCGVDAPLAPLFFLPEGSEETGNRHTSTELSLEPSPSCSPPHVPEGIDTVQPSNAHEDEQPARTRRPPGATRPALPKPRTRSKVRRRTYKDAQEDLVEALICVKSKVRALQTENRRLADVNAALELLDTRAAHLAGVLARADFPAPRPERALDCPVSAAVDAVIQAAWSGRVPPQGLFAAWTKISIQNIVDLDVGYRRTMRQWVETVAVDPSSRPHAQMVIVNALNTRNRLVHYLTMHAPHALMQFWAVALPSNPADIVALRQRMGDTALAMQIGREEVAHIAEAYAEYSSGMAAVKASAARPQRALSAARRACAASLGSMHSQALAADKVETLVAELRALQLRPVGLYQHLIAEATVALGWRCATALMLRAHPYVANIADACEILASTAELPQRGPLKGKRSAPTPARD
jgi:hypothetical protein